MIGQTQTLSTQYIRKERFNLTISSWFPKHTKIWANRFYTKSSVNQGDIPMPLVGSCTKSLFTSSFNSCHPSLVEAIVDFLPLHQERGSTNNATNQT